MTTDAIVLNYHDSLLHESDVRLLADNQWLNDRLIAFVYEYLAREIYSSESVSFVDPSTVQYLKLCESEDEARMCFLDPLMLDTKAYCFLPLNNNQASEAAGGTHWSLLLVDATNSKMYHFDSIGANSSEAMRFFSKFRFYFRLRTFENCEKFPKQTNSSDCGVYVLGI